uniref:Uncharacterized protein n=1 Tax=Arundo donax TaxID=35708 RepID=A0A0A9CEQ2_ARUDO
MACLHLMELFLFASSGNFSHR